MNNNEKDLRQGIGCALVLLALGILGLLLGSLYAGLGFVVMAAFALFIALAIKTKKKQGADQ